MLLRFYLPNPALPVPEYRLYGGGLHRMVLCPVVRGVVRDPFAQQRPQSLLKPASICLRTIALMLSVRSTSSLVG